VLEPAGEWVPPPLPKPRAYLLLRHSPHTARGCRPHPQATSETLGPSSSLTRSLPSNSPDRGPSPRPAPGQPRSPLPARLSRVSPLPRTPFTARLDRLPRPASLPPPTPPAWPALYASSAARLALFPLALFSARLGFLTICFRFHGSIVGIR